MPGCSNKNRARWQCHAMKTEGSATTTTTTIPPVKETRKGNWVGAHERCKWIPEDPLAL